MFQEENKVVLSLLGITLAKVTLNSLMRPFTDVTFKSDWNWVEFFVTNMLNADALSIFLSIFYFDFF